VWPRQTGCSGSASIMLGLGIDAKADYRAGRPFVAFAAAGQRRSLSHVLMWAAAALPPGLVVWACAKLRTLELLVVS